MKANESQWGPVLFSTLVTFSIWTYTTEIFLHFILCSVEEEISGLDLHDTD